VEVYHVGSRQIGQVCQIYFGEYMKLNEFISMWNRDGYELTKHEEICKMGINWMLLTAYSSERTEDYGRHFALTLAVDQNNEILAHDMLNMIEAMNPTQQTIEWFNENVSGGLD